MPPLPQSSYYAASPGTPQQPSCFQKLKLGLGMGMMVGATVGVMLGAVNAKASGLRLGREFFRHTGKTALQMGGTFGVFMMVAQGVRGC